MQTVPEFFTREMGLTHKEFMRTLPAAINPLVYEKEHSKILIPHPSGQVEIRLSDTTERCIGMIKLPRTPVAFRFSGLNHEERKVFLDRFDLYFHRGGG
ncbi:MAG: hypothetical protein GY703_20515 [Gammaproteobacteria bacterium]|nr:hypothetical protein [Gammaproteobacteria bacterium]